MGSAQPATVEKSVDWFGVPSVYVNAASDFALPFVDCLHSPLHRVITSSTILNNTLGSVEHSKDVETNILARKILSVGLGAVLTLGYIYVYEATVLVTAVYDVVIGAHKLGIAILRDHDIKGLSHLIDVTVGVLNVVALAVNAPLFELVTLAASVLQDAWKVQKSIDKGSPMKAAAHGILPFLRVAHNIEHFEAVFG